MTDIWLAIEQKHHLSITMLLPTHVHVKKSSSYTCSVLMELCGNGLFQHVEYAINCGANIHEKDFNGWTALHHAVYSGCTKTLDILLKYNIGIDCQDSDGETAAMLSIYYNELAVFKKLVEAGADLTILNDKKQSLIFNCFDDSQIEILTYLVKELNMNIDHQDAAGYTALKYLTSEGAGASIINFLISFKEIKDG